MTLLHTEGIAKGMTAPLDTVFAALSDPTRRAILSMLLEDDMAVTDVSAGFEISLAAISKHLGALARAGLITQERRGRVVWCKLEPDALRGASVWMQGFGQFDGPDMDALEALLDGLNAPPCPPDTLRVEVLTAETATWQARVIGSGSGSGHTVQFEATNSEEGPASAPMMLVGQPCGDAPITEFALSEENIQPVGEDMAMVSYRADFVQTGSSERRSKWRSSLWQRQAGHWILLFRQDTPTSP